VVQDLGFRGVYRRRSTSPGISIQRVRLAGSGFRV